HLKRGRQTADILRIRSEERRTVAVRGELGEFRLANLLDEAAVVAAVGRPEEVLPGHQMRGAVLHLCGVLARNLFACGLTQMRQALSKLKAQGATITRIGRYVQVLESPVGKAVLADPCDLAQSVEGACVSRSRLPADGAERRHSAICREFMRALKIP